MNRVKSPSVAAAEIWAKARTWVVRFDAIVLTLYLFVSWFKHERDNLRDLLPCSFDIANFGLYSQFTLRSHFSGYTSDLRGEDRQLVNHIIDSIDQIQNLSRYLDTDDFLCQITTSDSGLDDQFDAWRWRAKSSLPLHERSFALVPSNWQP
jgi:hypothetical protein